MHRNLPKNPWKPSRKPKTWRIENNNMQIEQEHLVGGPAGTRSDGLIPQLLKKMGCRLATPFSAQWRK